MTNAAVPAAALAAAVLSVSDKSIAVLAFADLSPEANQRYFADGIAEEILNALAKIRELKVAGRTSAFYFKSKNEKLQVIGETLGVAHILEGSVRKQGDRMRISAQLVRRIGWWTTGTNSAPRRIAASRRWGMTTSVSNAQQHALHVFCDPKMH